MLTRSERVSSCRAACRGGSDAAELGRVVLGLACVPQGVFRAVDVSTPDSCHAALAVVGAADWSSQARHEAIMLLHDLCQVIGSLGWPAHTEATSLRGTTTQSSCPDRERACGAAALPGGVSGAAAGGLCAGSPAAPKSAGLGFGVCRRPAARALAAAAAAASASAGAAALGGRGATAPAPGPEPNPAPSRAPCTEGVLAAGLLSAPNTRSAAAPARAGSGLLTSSAGTRLLLPSTGSGLLLPSVGKALLLSGPAGAAASPPSAGSGLLRPNGGKALPSGAAGASAGAAASRTCSAGAADSPPSACGSASGPRDGRPYTTADQARSVSSNQEGASSARPRPVPLAQQTFAWMRSAMAKHTYSASSMVWLRVSRTAQLV